MTARNIEVRISKDAHTFREALDESKERIQLSHKQKRMSYQLHSAKGPLLSATHAKKSSVESDIRLTDR